MPHQSHQQSQVNLVTQLIHARYTAHSLVRIAREHALFHLFWSYDPIHTRFGAYDLRERGRDQCMHGTLPLYVARCEPMLCTL